MPFFETDFAATLTQADLDTMPPSLRRAFDAWHAQHRARAEPAIPERTSLDEIAREMLRVIAGQAPAAGIGPWLDRYTLGVVRTGAMVRNPSALAGLAVAGRDLDLLNAVLDRPWFCPSSMPAMARALRLEPDPRSMELFNGSLHMAYGHRERPGLTVASMAFHAVNDAAPDAPPLLSPTDPLTAWCHGQEAHLDAWDAAVKAMVPARGERDGFRQQAGTNLVGQAVMMGWPEGVTALLNHGIDPYATRGQAHEFTSPLMLAGLYRETACVQALMLHTSFDLSHRFGLTDRQVEKRQRLVDDPQLWWGRGRPMPSFPEAGGLDVEFVLREPDLVQDPLVQDLVLVRLQGMTVAARRRFREGLSPTGARGLETMELQATVRDTAPEVTTRPRARL